MFSNFQGKTALVIASSQGLGKAIAEQLASLGANVMISSRDEEKLSRVKADLTEVSKGIVEYKGCNVTKKEEIQQLVQATVENLEQLICL